MIQLSVIIPTYNRKDLLRKAVRSVLGQGISVPGTEIIVIDDGSTDGTKEMILREFPSVTYFSQTNQGPASARNLGIEKARGEWLAFLDSDDEWLPGKLKAQVEFFRKNPDYRICQTEEIWIRNGRRVNPMKKHQKFGGMIFEKCLPLCLISPSAVMIHREVFEDVGPFDPTYPVCEDYELWLRIAAKYPVGLIKKPYVVKYGGHADQLSHKLPAIDRFRIRALQKILDSGVPNSEQRAAAHAMLEEKIRIYNLGANKRGKVLMPMFCHSGESRNPSTQWIPDRPSAVRDDNRLLSNRYPLTFQESRELAVIKQDLKMWGEGSIDALWSEAESGLMPEWPAPERKKRILAAIRQKYESLKSSPKKYEGPAAKPVRETLRIITEETDNKIYGDCPVASPETVCCNLKTIDAVENCAFGCSYCTIQTFYGDKAVIDANLKEKLEHIPIDPNHFYHYGTGQSSDSLIWGNRNGNLDDLCGWAKRHPNVLLEFKTKSDNVGYFCRQPEALNPIRSTSSELDSQRGHILRPVPTNIVLSWSLNPQVVIDHEEHFTASLDRRLEAARKVADQGIKVSFHFHPMIYFEGWKEEYPALAKRVQEMFSPEEVLFISFGSVTFIKPVMQAIRKRGEPTKILQMELVKAPHNKFTYPPDLKIEMFQTLYAAFSGWQEKVFFYLCMEEAKFWDAVFGWHYSTNELFESDFSRQCFEKIKPPTVRS